MKRASAAHHRVHRYVHRRLAALHPQKPRVRVLPARLQRPKMTKEELLHELEFACGDLPLVPVQLSRTVHFDPLPDFAATSFPEDDVAGPSLVQDSPQGNVASNSGPSTGWNPGLGGGIGGFGGGGGLPPSNPGNPGNPGNPPPAVTPEPGSLLLVATGVLGVAGTLRRRSRSLA